MRLRDLSQCVKILHHTPRLLLIMVGVALFSGCSYLQNSLSDDPEPTPTTDLADAKDVETGKEAPKVVESAETPAPEASSKPGETQAETSVAAHDDTQVDAIVDKKGAAAEKPGADIKPTPITDADVGKPIQDAGKPIQKETPVEAAVTSPPEKTAPPPPPHQKKTTKPKSANHFVITVKDKDPSHPFFGKGYPKGFSVNEVPGKEMVMERGKTYMLEVATNPLHDVYLSQKEIGWGSSAWTEGISGQFIYNGTITVKPGKSTPSTLFYACRNHPYMGGQIYVVNPGEKAKIKKHVAPSKSAIAASKKPKKVTAAMVNQKLMFANMLVKSKTTERVKKSNNTVAKQLQAAAVSSIESAKKALKSGDVDKAYALAAKGVDDLKQVKKLVPSESQLEHLKTRHKELVQSLDNFEKSHKKSYQRTVKKKGQDVAVDYDHDKVNQLKKAAEKAVKATDYTKANKALDDAQRIVTIAIKQMMDSQTVVYDLNFETAEEEYEYELRRFKGYEILIPIAVKMKRPSEGAQKLMQTYLEKGQKMRDAAIATAKQKNFPVAISMMLDATKEVRRALRMVGVTQ